MHFYFVDEVYKALNKSIHPFLFTYETMDAISVHVKAFPSKIK